jgi:hypothetical protein
MTLFSEVYHAFDSTRGDTDRDWGSSLAGQQLHTNAGLHQKDPECGCGYRRGFVAPERFWPFQLSHQNPRGELTASVQ